MQQNDFLALRRIVHQSIKSAGPRYTPGQEVGAPNLIIEELEDAIQGILCGESFRKRAKEFADKLDKEYSTLVAETARKQAFNLRKPKRSIELLGKIESAKPVEVSGILSRLKQCLSRHSRKTYGIRNSLSNKVYELKTSSELKEEDPEVRKYDNLIRHVRSYGDTISEIERFISSPQCTVQFSKKLLLLGPWGSGKTHHLADVSLKLIGQELPVLFLLAKDFHTKPSISTGITKHSQFGRTFSSLLNKLDRLGKKKGVRALLVVDGINESKREDWKKFLPELIRLTTSKENVGLVLSCRTPFEQDIFSTSAMRKFTDVYHQGFFDIEFDAQSEFFNYYSIPLPEVPMLAEEFSRPLTLKVLCQAFKQLPGKKQKKGFHHFTSGQRGMTFILETFVNSLGESIEKEFRLPRKFCWDLIKGRDWIVDQEISGLAPWMATHLQDYVPQDECTRIISADNKFRNSAQAADFLQRLISTGILIEEKKWVGTDRNDTIATVRFPYERFGDHIIARHLLKSYLDVRSEKTIRRSFYSNQPLGKIFKVRDKFASRFAMPGWAEAVIVEFPERAGKYLPEGQKELFFLLPKKHQSFSAYRDPCIDGMFWRAPSSICRDTDKLMGAYLFSRHEHTSARAFEVLFSIGTKAKHPYCGLRTFRNLENMAIADRDLFWSETVRNRSTGSAFERLINWCEKHNFDKLPKENAKHLIALISLLLTTTDRKMRDRATKVLVRIGEAYPRALFNHTIQCLSFSDLYVPERMLAACYGVAMSQWAFPKQKDFQAMLVKLARILVKEVFLPGGRLKSPHILIRDYVLGIVSLAEKVKPRCIATRHKRFLRPPFPGRRSNFPAASKILDEALADIDDAIRMDFENYTIGHLVPERGNYDMQHPAYQEILKRIRWRIKDLGYSSRDFKLIDERIGHDDFYRSQRDAPKIDRYGKKYSWIAFFEMYGILESQGKVRDDSKFERISDCDIDPSFPIRPPDFDRRLVNRITTETLSDEKWLIEGPDPNHTPLLEVESLPGCKSSKPWVLLAGSVSETGARKLHYVFTNLHGYLVKNSEFGRFQANLAKLSHPEPDFPTHFEDHYTFSGEVPWSPRFASFQRRALGSYRAFATEGFIPSWYETKTRKVKKGWQLLLAELGDVSKYFSQIRVVTYGEEEKDDTEEQNARDLLDKINQSLPKREQVDPSDFFYPGPTNEEIKAGYRTSQELIKDPGVKVEPTAWRYSWESYHSLANDYQGFHYPSPLICETLGLLPFHRHIDLRDPNGQVASVYREYGEFGDRSEFLYLRKDLLNKLLNLLDCKLIITAWGERRVHYERNYIHDSNSTIKKAFENHENRHSVFYAYDSLSEGFSVLDTTTAITEKAAANG